MRIDKLFRNRGFQLLWGGSVASYLGIQVADLAYPLAVLALTGSPAWAGAFGFVQLLAMMLCGLPAGHLLDRGNRRVALLVAEGSRALATASVAVAFALDRLTVGHLLVVAGVLGAMTPYGAGARMLLLRSVVPVEQLTAALTAEEVRGRAASMAGPPLGGLLYGLAAAAPFVFTAITYAVSWLCAVFVRVPLRVRAAGSKRGGYKALWRDSWLRSGILVIGMTNLVSAPLMLITVVVLGQQETPTVMIGLAMAGSAVGGLAGAGAVGPLNRRFSPDVLLLGGTLAKVPLLAGLALPWGPWWVGGLLFCTALISPTQAVLVNVLILSQVPDAERGRTFAAVKTLTTLGMPIGVGLSGLLLQYLGPAGAILSLVAALGGVVLALQWRARATDDFGQVQP